MADHDRPAIDKDWRHGRRSKSHRIWALLAVDQLRSRESGCLLTIPVSMCAEKTLVWAMLTFCHSLGSIVHLFQSLHTLLEWKEKNDKNEFRKIKNDSANNKEWGGFWNMDYGHEQEEKKKNSSGLLWDLGVNGWNFNTSYWRKKNCLNHRLQIWK
jgi:hypothetical protein